MAGKLSFLVLSARVNNCNERGFYVILTSFSYKMGNMLVLYTLRNTQMKGISNHVIMSILLYIHQQCASPYD